MRTEVKDGKVFVWLGEPQRDENGLTPHYVLSANDAEALGTDLCRQAHEARRTDTRRLLRSELRCCVDEVMRKYPGCGNVFPEFFEVLQTALEGLSDEE